MKMKKIKFLIQMNIINKNKNKNKNKVIKNYKIIDNI